MAYIYQDRQTPAHLHDRSRFNCNPISMRLRALDTTLYTESHSA